MVCYVIRTEMMDYKVPSEAYIYYRVYPGKCTYEAFVKAGLKGA